MRAPQWVVAGLGNPGPKYKNTRHNVGYKAVEKLASGSWTQKDSLVVSECEIAGNSCVLAKPQKYMNLSGEALLPFLSFYKVPPERLLVIHDEIDTEPGDVRLKQGGSAAGHRGVLDIARVMGDNFFRLRIGVGHPGKGSEQANGGGVVSDWVLAGFDLNSEPKITTIINALPDIIQTLLESGLDSARRLCGDITKEAQSKG